MKVREVKEAFEAATEKQIEAINLAAEGFTSKQIAIQLGVAPRTVDQRIDAVRAKAGGIPRGDLVRHFRAWKDTCDRTTYDPFPVADPSHFKAKPEVQPEPLLRFNDALTFDERAAWDRKADRLLPEIEPSDLGTESRLLFIAGGAVLILAGVVLTAAFSNALVELLSG